MPKQYGQEIIMSSEEKSSDMEKLLDALVDHMEESSIESISSNPEAHPKIVANGFHPIAENWDVSMGQPVSIRYCKDNKTYLGFFIGDLVTNAHIYHVKKDDSYEVYPSRNPGFFVPDLHGVIMGYESWWSPINSEEELKEITDDDIQNVWYVKALKIMEKKVNVNDQ
jgi:hypothetical protein